MTYKVASGRLLGRSIPGGCPRTRCRENGERDVTAADRAAASRAAQGLPPNVTDPGTLAQVARLMTSSSATNRRQQAATPTTTERRSASGAPLVTDAEQPEAGDPAHEPVGSVAGRDMGVPHAEAS